MECKVFLIAEMLLNAFNSDNVYGLRATGIWFIVLLIRGYISGLRAQFPEFSPGVLRALGFLETALLVPVRFFKTVFYLHSFWRISLDALFIVLICELLGFHSLFNHIIADLSRSYSLFIDFFVRLAISNERILSFIFKNCPRKWRGV